MSGEHAEELGQVLGHHAEEQLVQVRGEFDQREDQIRLVDAEELVDVVLPRLFVVKADFVDARSQVRVLGDGLEKPGNATVR